jgi:hypothetical protein
MLAHNLCGSLKSPALNRGLFGTFDDEEGMKA